MAGGTLEQLQAALGAALGERIRAQEVDRGQLILQVAPGDLVHACTVLRDDSSLAFTTLIDLLGVDYQGHGNGWDGPRYAVVYNFLSITHNWRVRLRVYCADDDFPSAESVIGVWPVAN